MYFRYYKPNAMKIKIVLFFLAIIKIAFSSSEPSIDSLINKADKYFLVNYDSSLCYYQTALKQIKNNNKSEIHCLSNLSVVYDDIGRVDTAIIIIYRAIELALSNKYDILLSEAYLRLGNYYKEVNDLKNAKLFYMKSININNNKGAYGALGILFSSINDTDSAQFYLFKSVEFYLKSDTSLKETKIALSSIYGQIGITYFNTREYTKGFNYFYKGLELSKEVGNPINVISFMLNLSSAYSILEENGRVEFYLTEAINIADTLEDLRIQNNINQRFYEFYYKVGKYKEAYNYLAKYSAVKDSLNELRYNENLKEKELNYLRKVQVQEIINIKLEKERQKITYVLTVIIVILFLLLVILIFYRKFKIKSIEANSLKKKSVKLESHLKEVIDGFGELNETISKQNTLITELQNKYEKVNSDGIQNELEKQKTIRDEDWKKYVSTFNLLYPEFLRQFLKKHSKLTNGDLRQIIMLKLAYSKEKSALILGISPLSIKRARQRLSKKIGLTDVRELYLYISTFKKY